MSYKDIASGSPYYDDFFSVGPNGLTPEQKNYIRILYNPSRAVQARELTQMQTLLQGQITHLSNHFFRDNSPIIGGKLSVNSKKMALTIDPLAIDGSTQITQQLLADWVINNYTFVNNIDRNLATKTLRITQFNYTDPNNPIIYIEVGGRSPVDNEQFWLRPIGGGLGDDVLSFTCSSETSYVISATSEDGIIYTNNHFILIRSSESILSDQLSGEIHAGYRLSESVATTAEDLTLADNAAGSPNFNAPGADRYVINPSLVGYNIDSDIAFFTDDVTGEVTISNNVKQIDSNFETEFAQYIVLDDADIVEDNSDVQYSDILDLLAERTFDESGNYTISEFTLNIKENENNGNLLTAEVGPGKAMVLGYEVDKQRSTSLTIPKAREFINRTGAEAFMSETSYVVAQSSGSGQLLTMLDVNDQGLMTLNSGQRYRFTDETGEINYGRTQIIGVEKIGDLFKIYVNRIEHVVNNPAAIKGITDFRGTGTSPTLKLLINPDGRVVYNEFKQPRVFRIQDASVVKSVTPTIYNTYKSYTNTSTMGGTGPFTLLVPNAVTGGGSNDFNVGDSAVSYAYNITKNEFLDMSKISNARLGNDLAITIEADAGATGVQASDDIYVSVSISNENGATQQLNKSLAFSSPIVFTHQKEAVPVWQNTTSYNLNDSVEYNGVLYRAWEVNGTSPGITPDTDLGLDWIAFRNNRAKLNVEDVYAISSIVQLTNVAGGGTKTFTENEINEIFSLKTGQGDFYYGYGKVKGFDSPVLDLFKADPNLNTDYEIVVEYFEHTGGADANYFSVDSYASLGDISKIPTYFSRNKDAFNLINCIDFRRKRSDISSSVAHWPVLNSDFNCSFENYLPRIDKIYADYMGNIDRSEGIPTASPDEPIVPQNAMPLYTITIPAYTFDSSSIKIVHNDNRRYTMADIRNLDYRVRNLEETVALTALEKQAADVNIIDPNTGTNKFSSGIFADPLTGHNLADTSDPEYRIGINTQENTLICPFSSYNFELKVPSSPVASGEVQWENLITLKLDEINFPSQSLETGHILDSPAGASLLAENPFASDCVNVNPYLTFKWAGELTLNPSVDTWFSTRFLPVGQDTQLQNNPAPLISNQTSIDNEVNNKWIGSRTLGLQNDRVSLNNANPAGPVVRNDIDEIDNDDVVVSPQRVNPDTGVPEILPPCLDDWVPLEDWIANPQCPDINTTNTTNNVIDSTLVIGANGSQTIVQTIETITETVNDMLIDRSVAPFVRPREVSFRLTNMRQGVNVKLYFDGVELVHNQNSIITVDEVPGTPGERTNNYRGLWQDNTVYSINDSVQDSQGNWYYTTVAATSSGNDSNLVSGSDTNINWVRFKLTDNKGEMTGTFTIPGGTFLAGTKNVQAIDIEDTSSGNTDYTSSGVIEIRQRQITSTRKVSRRGLALNTVPIGSPPWRDPIAQSFFVEHPAGVFLNAIDVYFKEKDEELPILLYMVEMRDGSPTANIVPLSSVSLDASQVNASATDPKQGQTRFSFSDPVYLNGNTEYAFILFTNSENYCTWISTLGEQDVFESGVSNPGAGIARQPYLGSLFKSQNSTTWTADQLSDITFKMWQCKFETNTTSDVYLCDDKETYDIDGNISGKTDIFNNPITLNRTHIRVDGFTSNIGDLILAGTSINYYYQFNSGQEFPSSNFLEYGSFINRSVVNLNQEELINNDSVAQRRNFGLLARMQTLDENITPVIDKQQMRLLTTRKLVLDEGVQNSINIWDSGKYISPNILMENEADEVRLLIDAKLPGNSYIDAYYRTSDYIPEFIEINTLPTDLNGVVCYIQDVDQAQTPGLVSDWNTGIRSLVLAGNVEDSTAPGGGNKLYIKSIQNPTAITIGGIENELWIYTKELFDGDSLSGRGSITEGVLWGPNGYDNAGADWNTGDICYHNKRAWRRRGSTLEFPNGVEPIINGEAWEVLPAYQINTGPNVIGGQIYQEDIVDWKPLRLKDNTRFFNGEEFYSYEFVPVDRALDEFLSYSIKIELKSVGGTIGTAAVTTPIVKNIRAIAAI